MGVVPATVRTRVVRTRTAIVVVLCVSVGLAVVWMLLAELFGQSADAATRDTLAAQAIVAGMTDQQAGLWGYVDTPQPTYIGLYVDGRDATAAQVAQLGRDTAGSAAAPALAAVAADVRAWEAWAEGVRLQVLAGGVGDPPAEAAEGRRLFDRFRADAEVLARTVDHQHEAVTRAQLSGAVSVAIMVAGAIVMAVQLSRLVRRMVKLSLDPVLDLAAAARRVARGEQMAIPYEERQDEIAELAGALRLWRDAAEERAVLSQQAPVGIVQADLLGHVVTANPAFAAMAGRSADELVGQPVLDLVHPDDRAVSVEAAAQVATGEVERRTFEVRAIRGDGAVIWTSVTVGPLRAPDGRVRGSVGMVEDVTERHRQVERAARVQRELWPRTVPELDDYQLAGACQPAENVAGDFYDWRVRPDGELELTVADVMGKGMGAALVMATLRASLRSAPVELGLAERLSLAAESVALGGEDGLFVTVFLARLQPWSGELRYVDAGHGHCAVRRPGGELVRLDERSLPVGVDGAEEFREGRLTLEPGETLVVYSDGLVEIGERMLDLGAYAAELDQAGGAEDAVRRLLGRMPARPADDVTVMVLRRLG